MKNPIKINETKYITASGKFPHSPLESSHSGGRTEVVTHKRQTQERRSRLTGTFRQHSVPTGGSAHSAECMSVSLSAILRLITPKEQKQRFRKRPEVHFLVHLLLQFHLRSALGFTASDYSDSTPCQRDSFLHDSSENSVHQMPTIVPKMA